jgi:ankyrin repeat protein
MVDVDAKDDDGRTALHWAAKNGHDVEVQQLLKHKADVDAKTVNRKTALYRETENRHEAVVRLLLEHKVNVDSKDNDGWTACCIGQLRIGTRQWCSCCWST